MFIDSRQVYTYMSSEFALNSGRKSNGWYPFKCPICDDLAYSEKAAVNFSYNWVKCWKCGHSSNVIQFIADYTGCTYKEARGLIKQQRPTEIYFDLSEYTKQYQITSSIELPIGYTGLFDSDGSMGKRARQYLQQRGFDLKVLDRIGFGYCVHEKQDLDFREDYFGYIIVPFRLQGKLVYYIGRDFIDRDEKFRYKNPSVSDIGVGKGSVFYNEDALQLYDEVFLAEGWADAATIGDPGISSQGWKLSGTQLQKMITSNVKRFILMPDIGVGTDGISYYNKAIQLGIKLLHHKEVVVLDLSQVGATGKDVNDIGKAETLKLYANTAPLTLKAGMEILTKDNYEY